MVPVARKHVNQKSCKANKQMEIERDIDIDVDRERENKLALP